jgi:hypothetical protein
MKRVLNYGHMCSHEVVFLDVEKLNLPCVHMWHVCAHVHVNVFTCDHTFRSSWYVFSTVATCVPMWWCFLMWRNWIYHVFTCGMYLHMCMFMCSHVITCFVLVDMCSQLWPHVFPCDDASWCGEIEFAMCSHVGCFCTCACSHVITRIKLVDMCSQLWSHVFPCDDDSWCGEIEFAMCSHVVYMYVAAFTCAHML